MEEQNPKDLEPQEQQPREENSEASLGPVMPSPSPAHLQTHPLSSLPKQTAPQGEGKEEGAELEEGKPFGENGGPLVSPTASAAVKAAALAPVTDLQKKLSRAERLGVPVQLSEEEKRSSRAERFGLAALQGKSEEQKMKARAERFGLAGNHLADDEAKKKARLARFGQDPRSCSLEEEKRKARAVRFSEITSSIPSQTNDNINSDLKMLASDKMERGT